MIIKFDILYLAYEFVKEIVKTWDFTIFKDQLSSRWSSIS